MKNIYIHLIFAAALAQTAIAGKQRTITNSINPILVFTENKGQVHDQKFLPNPAVKYLLPLNGLNLQLKENSFSYDTYVIEPDEKNQNINKLSVC